MKKQIYDLQSIAPDVDAEDEALLAMFPVGRQVRLNDMYLVRRGGESWLVRKEDVARARKLICMICKLVLVAGCIGAAVGGILSITRGIGRPGYWLLAFEACLAPWLAKPPQAVKGRFEK